jgi:hypothetical protein
MLSVFSHQGNANQNKTETPSHAKHNGYHQDNKLQQILARIWGAGSSPYSVLARMEMRAAMMEISTEAPQKLKIELTSAPAIPFWIYTQRNQSQHTKKIPMAPCLLQHCSQQPAYRFSLGAHQQKVSFSHKEE